MDDDDDIEEFDDAEEDYEAEEDDDDDEDDEESGEDDEDEDEEELTQEELQAEQRALLNRFKRIVSTAPNRFYPHLTPKEKDIVKQVRKIKPSEVVKLEQIMNAKKQAFWAKVKSVLATAGPFLLIFGLVLLLIILVLAILASIFPWLFGGDANSTGSSPYGIKGNDFYGLRAIYKDEDRAKTDLTTNYSETLAEMVKYLNDDASLKITVKLTLPEAGYNYENFETDYAETDAYKIVKEMAGVVYSADNAVDYSSITELDLNNRLAGIKYFGYNQAIVQEIADKVANYLTSNSLIGLDNVEVEGGEDLSMPSAEQISTALNTYFGTKTLARAEKLYVKDSILTGDDAYVEGITKQNYIALIFMPKRNVTFTSLTFSISGVTDISRLKITLSNGTELTPTVYLEGNDADTTIYQVSYSNPISASAFADLDAENINALASGLSVYSILTDESLNALTYLTLQESETETENLYTLKTDGVGINFEFLPDAEGLLNEYAFMATQFETIWE